MAYKNEINGDGNLDKLAELQAEKETISQSIKCCPNAVRLLNEEIDRLQGKSTSRDATKYTDVVKDRPTKVTAKVLIPTKEHPTFNFVGKLLGPKGNSMKRLQEETLTRMAVKGEGSMRDKSKEEELRGSGDPKYNHLTEDLHVEISAMAPAAEAYARIAHALAEIRKFLIPDNNDDIAHEQMMEMEMMAGRPPTTATRGLARGALRGGARGRAPLLATPPTPLSAQTRPTIHPTLGAGRGITRPTAPNQRALNILGKARQSIEDSYSHYDTYGYDSYNDNIGGGYDSYGSYSDTWPSNRSRRSGKPWEQKNDSVLKGRSSSKLY